MIRWRDNFNKHIPTSCNIILKFDWDKKKKERQKYIHFAMQYGILSVNW